MHFNFREVKMYSSWIAVIPYHQYLPSFLHLLDKSWFKIKNSNKSLIQPTKLTLFISDTLCQEFWLAFVPVIFLLHLKKSPNSGCLNNNLLLFYLVLRILSGLSWAIPIWDTSHSYSQILIGSPVKIMNAQLNWASKTAYSQDWWFMV